MRATVLLLGCLSSTQAGLWGKTEKKKKRRKARTRTASTGRCAASGARKSGAIQTLCRSRDMELWVDTHDFWLMHEHYCEDEKRADRPPCIRLERSPKSPRSTTRENRDRRERWTYGPREPRLPHHPEDEGWDRDNISPGRRKRPGPARAKRGRRGRIHACQTGALKFGSSMVWLVV